MTGYFTKLDAGITDSTVWREPDTTRLVWITLLSMADQNGYIGASVPGLADRARVSLDACLAALQCFRETDKWSRSQEFDGRRIADVEGGWVLLNHAKYRAMRDAEVRKEQVKQAVARFRAKPKDDVINGNQCKPRKPVKAQADTEAEADTKKKKPLADSQPKGFTGFWLAYPKGRREKKAEALKIWIQHKLESQSDAIINHVRAKAATHDWQKDDSQFAPMPTSYLRGKRWLDGDPSDSSGDYRPDWMKIAI